jgi:sugar O-acyltransferase (sialic acid O-acetyltransferase NeuD family)
MGASTGGIGLLVVSRLPGVVNPKSPGSQSLSSFGNDGADKLQMTATIIIGAGGHGKVVLDILQAGNQYSPVGFVDADPKLAGTRVGGLPVFGAIHLLTRLITQHRIGAVMIAIGDNRARSSYARTVDDLRVPLINAIHPSAVVSRSATLGRNVMIAANAVVCTEANIGDFSIINTAATVDHECEIGQAVHICPGAHLAGRVRVENDAFIGLGANIIQCLKIGTGATIGAGAVVLRDVPPHATAVGTPARIIKSRQTHAA